MYVSGNEIHFLAYWDCAIFQWFCFAPNVPSTGRRSCSVSFPETLQRKQSTLTSPYMSLHPTTKVLASELPSEMAQQTIPFRGQFGMNIYCWSWYNHTLKRKKTVQMAT